MLSLPGDTLILTRRADGEGAGALRAAGAIVEAPGFGQAGIDLGKALARLAELECNDVLVEAGPTLAGALAAAGLLDELVLYLAPHLMGDAARGLFSIPGLEKMADRVQLRITESRQVGEDLRLRAVPAG